MIKVKVPIAKEIGPLNSILFEIRGAAHPGIRKGKKLLSVPYTKNGNPIIK
jgi:hypothetical protein